MARIRTLKPDCGQHRKVGRLSDPAFRLWVILITQADDQGRLVVETGQLRLLAWGYHADVDEQVVTTALKELDYWGLIRLYTVEGADYAWFPSWHHHQKIDRPTPSRLPPYQDSSRTRRGLDEESTRTRRGSEGSTEGRMSPSEDLSVDSKDEEHTQDDSKIMEHFNRLQGEHPDWSPSKVARAAYAALNSAAAGPERLAAILKRNREDSE